MKQTIPFTNTDLISFDYGKKKILLNTIQFLESKFGNYTVVNLHNKQQILSSFTLKYYSLQLTPTERFFVVRKGLMININYLSKVEERVDGQYAIMKDGSSFRMSRRKGKELILFLEKSKSLF